ncbi:uncharacterized protein LOC114940165 [Nylanderia fulva]|uniref:uncharacterized protein LOC114940165 n=1 Tax=Nylanderia fulva TaxID=613905 RepID=UPI0010FB7F51|nr:uncharacterized protein LOC114940165 [Nylanderia fulva]
MAELRNLLISQVETIDSIKRVLVNFKKLAKANVTLAKTQGRLATLETLWTSCRGLHVKLLQATTSEEQKTVSYFLNGDFLSAEEIYHDTADLLRDTISRFSINQSPLLEHSTDSSIREGIHNHNFQLPRISLPKFSGKFSEWESFKNTFESLVASNDSLSNTQKFHYLKTSVISDAASIISNLKISDANYESVWQLLIDEYDDQLTLIHTHIHAFMCLPTMKTENVAEMRKLRDTVSASLAALTNLKRPVRDRELPSYKDIHEFLTLRIRGLSDFSDNPKVIVNSKSDKTQSSVHNLSAIKCICCSGSHSRHAIARQNRVCFNCLRAGHFTPKCSSKIRCAHCQRSHNTLLHNESDQNKDTAENSRLSNSSVNASTTTSKTVVVGDAAVASVQTLKP